MFVFCRKKGKTLNIFPSKPVCLCVPSTCVMVQVLYSQAKVVVCQAKDKRFLQPLKHVPHLLISTSAVTSEPGICCRPHQICTTYFYGSWPYMLQSADELNTRPEHRNIARRVHVSTHGRNNTGKGFEGTLAVLLWPIQQNEQIRAFAIEFSFHSGSDC